MADPSSPQTPEPAVPPAPPPPPRFRPLDWQSRVFLGPNGLRAGWRAALYVVLTALFVLFAVTLEHLLGVGLPSQLSQITPAAFFHQELLSLVTALAAAAVVASVERRSLGDYGLPWRAAFGARFWQGALWGIAQLSLLMLAIAALHGYSFGAILLDHQALERFAAEWAGVFLLVGLYEEFFFRGYVQFALTQGMGFWPAALVTSGIFGAVHITNPGEGAVGVAGVFMVGMFLCFTLRRTGSLWFAIGWHAAWDFGETFLYSVPDSGISTTGRFSSALLHGPPWLTGGTVGPEGSIFDFLVMALAFVVFDRIYRGRGETATSPRW